MMALLNLLIKIYGFLLRLYPTEFRSEFAEQMLLDFSDLAKDAGTKGRRSLLRFCIREIVDFPINLLRIHLREGSKFEKLRSQPLNSGLRSALGFSAGFACTAIAAWWGGSLLFSVIDPIAENLAIWVSEFLRNKNGADLFALLPLALYFCLTSTGFGFLIALFLGNRFKFSRYVIVGAICWVIPEILSYVLVWSLGSEYYRNERLAPILGYLMLILVGAFLSAAYPIAASGRKAPLRTLVALIIIYPFGTYFFIKLLFRWWQEITPGFAFSLIAFMIVLIAGVVALVVLSNRKSYLVVGLGAIGYFLLNRFLFYIAYSVPGASIASEMGMALDVFFYPARYMAIYKAILGALFGLILGLMFGSQKQAGPSQLTESTPS